MKVLGIETSCDETAVCLIRAEGALDTHDVLFKTLGNALHSQIETHRPYGGVFPNLAKREHAKNLVPMLVSALEQAEMLIPADRPAITRQTLDELKIILEREEGLFAQLVMFFAQYQKPDIDALAVTVGPGLEPALWVGVNFARALSLAWDVRVVPVNHMEGHIVVSAVEGNAIAHTPLPALALLISGGHTELVRMNQWFEYKKIGQTRDDAVGEAFDKVARLLGLPYPGGPEISKLATEARAKNIASPFKLPRAMLQSGDLDFSFSGLKTAVLYLAKGIPITQKVRPSEKAKSSRKPLKMTRKNKADLAASFQQAVVDALVHKTLRAAKEYKTKTIILGGGVAANQKLREELKKAVQKELPTTICLLSPVDMTGDNALMIALAALAEYQILKPVKKPGDLRAVPNLRLDQNMIS